MPNNKLQPVAVPAGAGRALENLGVRSTLTSSQTGGACYFFEDAFGPGDGNRLHVHSEDDEIAYVLEGALVVRLGGASLEVSAGGIAFLPKGIPHALQNPLATPSRYLFAALPGRALEGYFEALEAALQDGPIDMARKQELAGRFGLEWLE